MTQMPNSPGHSTVKEYAHDNSLWLAEFSLVNDYNHPESVTGLFIRLTIVHSIHYQKLEP